MTEKIEPIISATSNFKETKLKDIWYISDLHFDGLDLVENITHDKALQKAKEREKNFLEFVSKRKNEKLFILAGDFWDNFNHTVNFFKKLEELEIESFFVLGNHDY